ncbi:hypothetical protein D3C77_424840 [compost metagenome]
MVDVFELRRFLAFNSIRQVIADLLQFGDAVSALHVLGPNLMVLFPLQHPFEYEVREHHFAPLYRRKRHLEVRRKVINVQLFAQKDFAELLRLKGGMQFLGCGPVGVDVLLLGRCGERYILNWLEYGFVVPAAEAGESAELLDALELELRLHRLHVLCGREPKVVDLSFAFSAAICDRSEDFASLDGMGVNNFP